MTFEFSPISDNRALSERIISLISDAIIGGELRPGDRLPSERELAQQLRVSRTVVRDAVKTLAGRGLVRVKHGAGIFVAAPEDEPSALLSLRGAGLNDLFEIRKALEVKAAGWAAERHGPHHLQRLHEIVEDARRHADDLEVLSKRDAQFHCAVAEASRNLVLVRVMLMLLDLLEDARRETLSIPGRAELSIEDHERVIQAIEARDTEGARQAMLEHLNSVEESLMDSLESGTVDWGEDAG